MAFDTNFAPILGQQVTLGRDSEAAVAPRLALLMTRADAGDCDLVAKGRHAKREAGYLYIGGGLFRSDRSDEALLTSEALRRRARAPSGEITFTCVPPLSGMRIGIDRDEDGVFDGDELSVGSNPADRVSRR